MGYTARPVGDCKQNTSQAIEDEIRSRSDLSEKSKRSHMTNQQQEMIERITNEAAFQQLGQTDNNGRTDFASLQKSAEDLRQEQEKRELEAKKLGAFSKTGTKFTAGINLNINEGQA